MRWKGFEYPDTAVGNVSAMATADSRQPVKKQSQDNTTQKWLFDGWLSSMRIRMEEVHLRGKQ